ncbi:MAG: MFS transporter [Bacteroidota bacterium]|nr:MFS transporter [Bacteroidota bacterium]MDP4236264.1 MFS transporter [Bacteroidota bacterium]
MPKLKKSVIAGWSLFDFANSSFAMIMVTFVYPLYYANVIVNDGNGDLYWGIAMSSSMLLVALIAPALGAIADSTRSKKKVLFVFTFVAVIATAATYFLQPGMIALGAILFILGNAGFEGGIVFYDAFLPEISPPEKFGKVSGIGFAVGYLGSLAAIVVTKDLLLGGKYPESFLVTAAMFAVFAMPIFLFVPESRHEAEPYSLRIVKDSFREVIRTMRRIRQYKSLATFLVAFFLYNDAILTVIGFSGLYAKNTLNFETGDLIKLFAMVQTVAIVGSMIFGYITDRTGPRLTIMITLAIWLAVVIGAYLTSSVTSFYVVAAVAGLALGSSQSASRSMMALLTPKEHTAEFFGFYDGFCGKASAVVGPLVFGILSRSFGQRQAIISLGLFFLTGLVMMRKVRVQ